MTTYYAGIGSRDTPVNIQKQMYLLAKMLASKGWVLRSGGAKGADTAFYKGVTAHLFQKPTDALHAQIFLPWDGFKDHKVIHSTSNIQFIVPEYAESVAQLYHSGFRMLSQSGKLLISRNSYQVLGPHLTTPSKVVLCYTMDGKASGGTGQAIRIARDKGIKIVNMYSSRVFEDYVDEIIGPGAYSSLIKQVNLMR